MRRLQDDRGKMEGHRPSDRAGDPVDRLDEVSVTDSGSFAIGLSVGIALVVIGCLAIDMPIPTDGWADAAMSHGWGRTTYGIAGMIVLAFLALTWAGWHGPRTVTGVLLAFAFILIGTETMRMHDLIH